MTKEELEKGIFGVLGYGIDDVIIASDEVSITFADDYDEEAAGRDACKVADYLIGIGVLDKEAWDEGGDYYFDMIQINEDDPNASEETEDWRYVAEWRNLGPNLDRVLNNKLGEERHMKSNKRKINESIDLDEVYDELENQGIKYSANEVGQGVNGINWDINEEDIPLCVAGLLRNKVQLTNVQSVTYDEGEFTEWLENDQSKFDGGYQIVDHTGTTRYFGWNYGGGRTKELFIQKKTIFTTKAPVTESKKPAKKALKEGMNGCFYIIHESPIGYKGRQGWIDDYSELTSDVGSAEQYDTLQEAVDMLYAIEDYVENFNDNEGIRATIQCVNPDDPNQVLEDMAVVDIQKRWGVVDCEPVSGEQNLINCGYWVEDSEPSMGYNL